MSTRITIPDGKVAVVMNVEDAQDLSSLLILIGKSPGTKVRIEQPMADVAKSSWFDVAVGLSASPLTGFSTTGA